MEIPGRVWIIVPYIRQVPGDLSRRQTNRAAQRDGGVSEIASNTVPARDDFRCGEVRAPGTEAVFDVFMNPIADGLHARQAVGICSNWFHAKSCNMSESQYRLGKV
jgi:hypothetical protein